MCEFQLGRHEQAIDMLLQGQQRVEQQITVLQASVADIANSVAERKGERRMTLWFMGTGSAVLGSVLTLIARYAVATK